MSAANGFATLDDNSTGTDTCWYQGAEGRRVRCSQTVYQATIAQPAITRVEVVIEANGYAGTLAVQQFARTCAAVAHQRVSARPS